MMSKTKTKGPSVLTETAAIASASDDLQRELWATRHGAAYLVPGFVLLPEISSQGGSTAEGYSQQPEKKGSNTRIVTFKKKVDNVELEREVMQATARARYLMDEHAARFVASTYFVPDEDFEKADRALDECRKLAEACNKLAKKVGSRRQTVIELYKFRLDPADHRVAVRLGGSIHRRLTLLREAYTADNRRAYQIALQVCSNLDKLVGRTQREAIRLALRSADAQRPLMIAHYGGRKGTRELRRTYGDKIPDFDFGPIDAAIEIFAPIARSVPILDGN